VPIQLKFPPELDESRFLARYWQCRPLLLRQALPAFESPISAYELAGLACEEEVESRLVLEHAGTRPWEVRHGPFDEENFSALPQDRWTLLVQDADKHLPEVAAWLDAFRFVPDWRVDDIMISYAEDGGSVGPHIDEYDVFLIQAQGRRRWLIDPEPAFDAGCIPGLDLRILEDFNARETHVLEPGDILYLPPGVPHWGIADGPCMTWSVGFRAPAWHELAVSWCEHTAERHLLQRRYGDPGLQVQAHSGEILPQVFENIHRTLKEGFCNQSEQAFRQWFGCFATEPKEQLLVYPNEAPQSPMALHAALHAGLVLQRNSYSRMAFCRGTDGTDLLFANGEAYPFPAKHGQLLPRLTGKSRLDNSDLSQWLDTPECLEILCRLHNEGHYELIGYP